MNRYSPYEPGPEMHLDRAEWVIVGYHPSEGGVAVLASRTLSSAVLEAKRDEWMDSIQDRVYASMRPTVVIECRDYVLIRAESWRQVMEALYRKWAPQDGSAFT